MDQEENKSEDSLEEEQHSEEQASDLIQQAVISWNEYLISAFLGLPEVDRHHAIFEHHRNQLEFSHPQPHPQPHPQLIGNVHYLEQEESQGPPKRPHSTLPPFLVPKLIFRYRYLKLANHEYRFDDDEGKEILLTPTLEPNVYIRKLVERIPSSISQRLHFLSRFLNDSDNRVLAVDTVESSEKICSTQQLTMDTIFTNLKEQLYSAYLMEMRLRRAFRNVLQRWRVYHIHKKEITNMDPITLVEPKKSVEVYDMKTKTRYRFDATSLATWIESNLHYHEGGFAVPMNPRNPWTNVDFTYPQLISIYNQLKEHGELRWAFTTFREYQFNKSKWQLYHTSALTMRAIRASLTNLDSYDARELLEDFIYSKMDDLHIYTNDYIQQAYRIAILRVPHHWYIEEFKAVAFQHYEAEHYRQNRQRMIHNRCDQIFRKQDQFIRELQHLGLVGQPSSRNRGS